MNYHIINMRKNKIYLDYLMEIYNSIIFDENNSSDKEINHNYSSLELKSIIRDIQERIKLSLI